MKILCFLCLGPISSLSALSLSEAEARAENRVIVCERAESLGLYKQCFEGTILEKLGSVVRVYSHPEKRVITSKPERIYSRQSLDDRAVIQVGQHIAIPGRYLWNTTPEGYQSICQIDSVAKSSKFVSVSCGRYHGEKILRSKIILLKAWNDSSEVIRN